jgi:hypothetical protein
MASVMTGFSQPVFPHFLSLGLAIGRKQTQAGGFKVSF